MVMQNLRVFAYIARSYNSAAEATSLVSSVASLAIKAVFFVPQESPVFISGNFCFWVYMVMYANKVETKEK